MTDVIASLIGGALLGILFYFILVSMGSTRISRKTAAAIIIAFAMMGFISEVANIDNNFDKRISGLEKNVGEIASVNQEDGTVIIPPHNKTWDAAALSGPHGNKIISIGMDNGKSVIIGPDSETETAAKPDIEEKEWEYVPLSGPHGKFIAVYVWRDSNGSFHCKYAQPPAA